MKRKKNIAVDLAKKKGLFFNIGLFVSLILVTAAFEWRDYEDGAMVDLSQVNDDFEDLLEIPPTRQPPPPPPKVQQPEIVEVPDEEEIEEDIEIDLDIEITEDEVIEDIIVEEAPEEEVADKIFQIVEEPATPKGGYEAFYQFISKNMNYPSAARRMGIEGKVFVQFVVSEDGSLSDISVLKGIGAGCDEEAIRILKKAPNWNPPKQRGNPVKQKIAFSINFKLN